MVLNIYSDAPYASGRGAKSCAAGHYFLGRLPRDNAPIRLNGAIYTLCNIMKFVTSSTAEAELGAFFMNAKEVRIIRLTLKELVHPQPPTPMHLQKRNGSRHSKWLSETTAFKIYGNAIFLHLQSSEEQRI